jgi:hypothetical protein
MNYSAWAVKDFLGAFGGGVSARAKPIRLTDEERLDWLRLIGRVISKLVSSFNRFLSNAAIFYVATCCILFSLFSEHFCYFAEIDGNSTQHACDMAGPHGGETKEDLPRQERV